MVKTVERTVNESIPLPVAGEHPVGRGAHRRPRADGLVLPTIETLQHAIGVRPERANETMPDGVVVTHHIKRMRAVRPALALLIHRKPA